MMKTVSALSAALLVLAVVGSMAETKPEADERVKYSSYAQMARSEKRDIDFKVVYRHGSKSFLIAAPHGGGIEPGSSELADAIAGDTYGFYSFYGLKKDPSALYLPSTGFDEPELMRVTKNYSATISVHVIEGSDSLIYIGGSNRQLADAIAGALGAKGYLVKVPPTFSSAFSSSNFINRSVPGGVQIEITSALVGGMFRGPVSSERIRTDKTRRTAEFSRFVDAVRLVLDRSAGRSSGARIHRKQE